VKSELKSFENCLVSDEQNRLKTALCLTSKIVWKLPCVWRAKAYTRVRTVVCRQ